MTLENMSGPGAKAGLPLSSARVLVTGGAGFVGRRLVARFRELISNGETILAGRSVRSGQVQMDLEDPASVDRAVQTIAPHVVIHLGAQSSVGQAQVTAGQTWSVNSMGTLHLARSIQTHCPDATVLYASSSEIYGAAFNRGVVFEDTLPEPQSAYSRSKLVAEMILGDVLSSTNRLIVARPSNHSGKGQDHRFVLPSFAAQIASGAPEIKVGNLAAERDFLHVEDVIDAYILLLHAAETLPPRSVFNIASGDAHSIGGLLDRMIELSGRSPSVVVDPARLRASDIPKAEINAERLRSVTGWKPLRSMDEMLLEILADQV